MELSCKNKWQSQHIHKSCKNKHQSNRFNGYDKWWLDRQGDIDRIPNVQEQMDFEGQYYDPFDTTNCEHSPPPPSPSQITLCDFVVAAIIQAEPTLIQPQDTDADDDLLQAVIQLSLEESVFIETHPTSENRIASDWLHERTEQPTHSSKTILSTSLSNSPTTFCEYWNDARETRDELLTMKKRRRRRRRKEKKITPMQKVFKECLPSAVRVYRDVMTAFGTSAEAKIESIMKPEWKIAFEEALGEDEYAYVVFHGTDSSHDESIGKYGLVPGGERAGKKKVSIAHGSAHGRGVYCSPHLSLASSYLNGSLYVCLVTKALYRGRIWVAPTSSNILPCYRISFRDKPRPVWDLVTSWLSAGLGYGPSHAPVTAVTPRNFVSPMEEYYVEGPLNHRDPTRRFRRRW